MTTIYTHDGAFHPDEVLAIALLNNAGFDYPVIRTRDVNILAMATDECFTVDVGGVYDGECKFDHHQAKTNTDECFGISSAGLVAKYLGTDEPTLTEFINFVDTRDTRIGYKPENNELFDELCNDVVSLNNINIHGEEQDAAFNDAVEMMSRFINSDMERLASYMELHFAAKEAKASKEAIFTKRKEELVSYTQNKNKIYIGEYVPGHMLPNDWAFFMSYDDGQQAWTVLANTRVGHVLAQDQGKFVHAQGFIGKFKSLAWGHWYDGSDGFKDAVFFKEENSDYRYELPVGDVYYR